MTDEERAELLAKLMQPILQNIPVAERKDFIRERVANRDYSWEDWIRADDRRRQS